MKRKLFITLTVVFSLFMAITFNSNLRSFFVQTGTFLWGFISSPKSVGAIAPSSSYLSEKITKYIKRDHVPIKVLEVGAGTGVFTREIAQKLKEDDVFDVIEINSDFCGILKETFKNQKNININCISILDHKPNYQYDFIVSGLPFNSLASDFVKDVLDKYKKIIKNDGMISYFEYMFFPSLKKIFLGKQEKIEYLNILKTTSNFRKSYQTDLDKVWVNFPPAYVHHLKISN